MERAVAPRKIFKKTLWEIWHSLLTKFVICAFRRLCRLKSSLSHDKLPRLSTICQVVEK